MEDVMVGGYLVKGDRYYTKEHEWVLVKSGNAQVGITDYAQRMLGDIVYVELPAKGEVTEAGETLINIESVKNVAPVYSPITGTVVEINELLEEEPHLINESPYDAGWIAIIEMSDPSEVEDLMTAEDYAEFLAEIVKEENEEETEVPIEESIETLPEEELGFEEEK